jgi:predicted Zn-dependent protease
MPLINCALLYRALTNDPGNVAVRLQLAELLIHNGAQLESQTHYWLAYDHLLARLAESPGEAQLYSWLATAQEALGDVAGALNSLALAARLARRVWQEAAY